MKVSLIGALLALATTAVYAEDATSGLVLNRLVLACADEDLGKARAAELELEKLTAHEAERRAARGLMRYLQRDFEGALSELREGAPADPTGYARLVRARAAFMLGNLDESRQALAGPVWPSPDVKAMGDARLETLLAGPFRARWPHLADALEGPSPQGHYRVVTDLAMPEAELARLEGKLAEASPAQRTRLVAQVRKKHQGLRRVGWLLDRAHEAFSRLFPAQGAPKSVTPSVYVLRDRDQFQVFSRALDAPSGESTLGYYLPGHRALVVYDRAEGKLGAELDPETRSTLLHETFHQWLHLFLDDAPMWFNEGLAEYFGVSEVTAKEYRFGLNEPGRRRDIGEALWGSGSVPVLPLRDLLRVGHAEFMLAHRASVNYAHAWSLVHYLGSHAAGQKLLKAYFQALRRGVSAEEAYRDVFSPLDLEALERQWKEYVARLGQ